MVRIELDGLSREFGDGTKVGPVDLTAEDGELLTLLGPSGSGKTTTLRMIAGFIKADKGQLRFDGQDIGMMAPRDRNIGMVFQNIALFPNMSVYQNIAFGLEMAKWSYENTVARVEELASLLGIENLLRRRVNEISGGEAQRVALARALAKKPNLLLLDEPLAALDLQLKDRLQIEIRRIQQELEITTIYVTHSQPEAFGISDRIAVLNEGTIVQVGLPEDLYNQPVNEFVARFLGMGNVIAGRATDHSHGITSVEVGTATIKISGTIPKGERTVFSVKPEDIRISSEGEGIESEVISLIPQVGTYRLVLAFNGMQINCVTRNNRIVDAVRSGRSRLHFSFNPEDAVLLK